MTGDLVSIITPSYNSEQYISKTIDSIINQTYTNWELLITDDLSSDSTVEIIESYVKDDSRIKLYKLEKNSGAGIARNFSINKAQGRYIAFCDSDDLWKPYKLEIQIEFMLKNNLSLSYSNYDVIDVNGKLIDNIISPKKITYGKMLLNCYIGCLTVIYDSEKIGKQYMPEIRKRQDWALWLKILKRIKETKGIGKSLALYRKRKNSLSNNKLKLIASTWKIYYNVLNFNFFKSLLSIFIFFIYYFKKKLKIF